MICKCCGRALVETVYVYGDLRRDGDCPNVLTALQDDFSNLNP